MAYLKRSKVAGVLVLTLLFTAGCGSTKNEKSPFPDASHPSGWLPAGHMTAAQTNMDACVDCHGSDLGGGISRVSCTSCHLGSATSVHPLSWSGAILTKHGAFAAENTTSGCANAVCHGTDLGGVADSGPSCTSCHMGGPASGHPSSWDAPIALNHAPYVQANGTSGCATVNCHGTDLSGVSGGGPSCTSCHMGGVTSVHPASWGTGTQIDLNHAPYVSANDNTACRNNYCHGSSLTGVAGSGPSCSSCHLGGATSVHPGEWGAAILTQHGPYASANTSDRCANAACHGPSLTGVTGSGPSCTSCHIGGVTSVHPASWGTGMQIDLNHATYVQATGTSGCANANCHGPSLTGVTGSGPSCTSCHIGGATSVHPAEWGTAILMQHGPYASINGTSGCANANCHGPSLTGVTGSGPSCTSCHIGGATSGHPAEWGTAILMQHGPYASTNGTSGCATANCHGPSLTGVTGSGPSCTSCHLGGTASGHPSSWAAPIALNHGPYVQANGTSGCANANCHGPSLTGVTGSGPSCTSCHIGGATSVHPSEWGAAILTTHGAYVAANTTSGCATANCHGPSLTGVAGSGPSCTSCHMGGAASGHPSSWAAPIALNHGPYVQTSGTSGCANANCHGPSLTGVTGSGPSCSSCHIGGAISAHPLSWGTGTQIDLNHAPYVAANGNTACGNNYCHGSSLTGVAGSGPSCSSCHLGGAASVHPGEWGDAILTQHGPYASANTSDRCANAACHGPSLTGVTGSGPSCTSCHIGGVESGHPADWADPIALNHAPYVQANGTNGCANTNCHGPSLSGVTGSGPSCTSCHIGGVTSVHPASWGTGTELALNHSPYVAAQGSSSCQNNYCHGSTLSGVVNSGPGCISCHPNGAFPFAPANCTSCHGNPPTGVAAPNRTGAHNTSTGHFTAQVSLPDGCNTCHSGAGTGTSKHFNGTFDVQLMSSVYSAKSGTAVYNADGTCSKVSCHGGQTTPTWLTGSINWATQCTSCHAYGTSEYNSFNSGKHNVHVNEQGIGCTECHFPDYVAASHFSSLNTTIMEGPASQTMADSVQYFGGTCSPQYCHDNGSWSGEW